MENIQRNHPAKVAPARTLSGPLTWVILLVFLISVFAFVQVAVSNSPAIALRSFYQKCFKGDYASAWKSVKPSSEYSQQYDNDVSKFEEMWVRTKTHGTSYLKLRIDGVEFSAKSTPSLQTCVVAYTVMTRDQSTDSKGTVSNQINDANFGYMTLERASGGDWKLIKPSR
jgi:hypothetical protein